MNLQSDPTTTGLLLLINRLQRTGQFLGRGTILPLADIKLPQVAREYDSTIDRLLKEKLIEGDAERFSLSAEGESMARDVAQQHSLHAWFYNEYYQAIRQSRAHGLFCERVYGKNLGQHGMADMEQIECMLAALEIRPNMVSLDFGCGDGQIAEYIAGATQSMVIGVDIANEAIRLAELRTRGKRDRLSFQVVDAQGMLADFSGNYFDRIWAIDSLFFLPDPFAVTRRFLELLKPQGRMGVFYICPPELAQDETPFARALAALGMTYRVQDLSSQNTVHWQKKKQVLLELEAIFKAEGNEFLFKNRLAECEGLEAFHRYLYILATA